MKNSCVDNQVEKPELEVISYRFSAISGSHRKGKLYPHQREGVQK